MFFGGVSLSNLSLIESLPKRLTCTLKQLYHLTRQIHHFLPKHLSAFSSEHWIFFSLLPINIPGLFFVRTTKGAASYTDSPLHLPHRDRSYWLKTRRKKKNEQKIHLHTKNSIQKSNLKTFQEPKIHI